MERYDLIPIFKRRRLTLVRIAAAAGCSHQNVTQFLAGEHSSLGVARAIMALTQLSPREMARLSRIPAAKLKEAA